MIAKNKTNEENQRREIGVLKTKLELQAKDMTTLRSNSERFRKKFLGAEQEVVNKTTQYETLLHTLKEEKKKHHAEGKLFVNALNIIKTVFYRTLILCS